MNKKIFNLRMIITECNKSSEQTPVFRVTQTFWQPSKFISPTGEGVTSLN